MRGQGSIEYLTIYAAILVVFGSITIPHMVDPGQNISKNAEDLARARNACDKITNAVNGVYSSTEGSVMTEFMQNPQYWKLKMNEDNLRIGVSIDNEMKWIESGLKYGFDSKTYDVPPDSYSVIVEWNEGNKENITLDLVNDKIYINIRPDGGN